MVAPNFRQSATLVAKFATDVHVRHLVSPLSSIQQRAIQLKTSVKWFLDNFDLQNAAQAATNQDVVFVFINAASGEEYVTIDGNVGDRNNLTGSAIHVFAYFPSLIPHT